MNIQAKDRRGEVKSRMPAKCMTYSRKKKKWKIITNDKFNVFVCLLLFIVLLQVGFGHVCYRPIVSYYERISVETTTTADVDTDTGVAGVATVEILRLGSSSTSNISSSSSSSNT